jgi:hypothetical protein
MPTADYSASLVTKNNQNAVRFAYYLKQQTAINAGASVAKEQAPPVTQGNVVERIQGGVVYYANGLDKLPQ